MISEVTNLVRQSRSWAREVYHWFHGRPETRLLDAGATLERAVWLGKGLADVMIGSR